MLTGQHNQGQSGQYLPQQQYGQYPPPPQQQQPPYSGQQYGGPQPGLPQPANPQEVERYKRMLSTTIQQNGLERFFRPGDPRTEGMLNQWASVAPGQIKRVSEQWRISLERARDLIKLALYDIVLYIDDSGSMSFYEERKAQAIQIISQVVSAAILFDDDGISLRFMNWQPSQYDRSVALDKIKSEDQIQNIVRQVPFQGQTPLGSHLSQKVLEPLVLQPARSNALRKPILVIMITDGEPTEAPKNLVLDHIIDARENMSRMSYGNRSVVFEIAQVGDDEGAARFLASLDDANKGNKTTPTGGYMGHPAGGQSYDAPGNIIDVTSNFEREQAEFARVNPQSNMTRELWIMKMLLGAIDPNYDKMDDSRNQQGPGSYGQQQHPSYQQPQQ
ncbi:MAG: hypothetical protein Q9214_007501, partial [Letrouitia sp. 1 TL-2023]